MEIVLIDNIMKMTINWYIVFIFLLHTFSSGDLSHSMKHVPYMVALGGTCLVSI